MQADSQLIERARQAAKLLPTIRARREFGETAADLIDFYEVACQLSGGPNAARAAHWLSKARDAEIQVRALCARGERLAKQEQDSKKCVGV